VPALGVVAVIHAVAALATIVLRRVTLGLWLFDVRLGNVTQLLLRAALAYGLMLALSPAARRRAAAFFRSRGFFAVHCSPPHGSRWDPHRRCWAGARPRLTVPASVELRAGIRRTACARALRNDRGLDADHSRRIRRRGHRRTPARRNPAGRAAAAFLYEAGAAPFIINGATPVRGFNSPEARLYPRRRAPAVYSAVAQVPPDAVLAELPIGQPDFDLRAMFYSTTHWRSLVNGYSGFFPVHYGRVTFALGEIARHPEVSLNMLRTMGATHVIVHEAAYLDGEGRETTTALSDLGARELFRDGGDVLLALPGP
jgi:hypothetical protein